MDNYGALDELGHAVELLENLYDNIWKKEMDSELNDAVRYIWDSIDGSYGSGCLCVGLCEYQTDLHKSLTNGYELPDDDNEEELKVWEKKTSTFIKKVVEKDWI